VAKKDLVVYYTALSAVALITFIAFFHFWLNRTKEKYPLIDTRPPKAGHFPSPPITTPVLSLPTPTPTLTPEELREIRRKQFGELNQKYGPCRYVPVLMYHHVMEAKDAATLGATYLNVPPEVFRGQMDYLLQKGYRVIGLDEMVEGIRNNSLPAKPIVLTFDDGYRDFYDYVYPILREKGTKATLFVISQFVGGERYLVWPQIKEMVDSGLILPGNHTLNHPYLTKLTDFQIKDQIFSANNILREHLGRSVHFFAYPYGGVNPMIEQALKEGGFQGAVVTTNQAPQCLGLPYRFSRIRIGATSLNRYGL
jgi:peptidoglycan/xylan/chitin deacetylase (PgdA/CDA1 family)